MRQCLKDTGFRWPQKPPNASEVKFNNLYNEAIQKETNGPNILWFRKELRMDSTITQNLVATIFQSGASEIYLDGKLINSLGKVSSNPDSIVSYNPEYRPLSFPMIINKAQVLAVRFVNSKQKFSLFQKNTGFLEIWIAPKEYAKTIHGNQLEQGFVWLLNDWKLKVGDDPEWASPEFKDSSWQITYAPTDYLKELSEKTKNSPIVWFRKKIRTDSTLNQNVIARIYQSGASEIYLDGKLIHKLGKVHHNPDSVLAYSPRIKSLSLPLQKQKVHTLAIRFVDYKRRFPLFSSGNNHWLNISLSTLEFASNDSDVQQHLKRIYQMYIALGVGAVMFIIFMGFFLFFPAQKINLYFSLSVLFSSFFLIYFIIQLQTQYLFMYHFISGICITISMLLTLYCLYKIFQQKFDIMFWIVLIYGLLNIPLLLVFQTGIKIILFGIIFFIEVIRISIKALKTNKTGAIIILFFLGITLFFLIGILLHRLEIINIPELSQYQPFAFMSINLSLAIYLGYNFGITNQSLLKKLKEVKQLSNEKHQILSNQNITLEKLVNERTSELNQSFENLKSTQSQLIQSEKMASLGELTAGIAHEIQNPLNFVNNFSEVNKELLDEMREEIVKKNFDEVDQIAKDVIENEQKIIHHGKRADAIVKGMLQHSRTSNGQKELTDINALADEYLRLSYHGLRAKDKSFNADFKTEFDENLPKINVIPQDIGRVLLNLINNAFYAAPLPPPAGGGFKDPNYIHKPMVIVKTSFIPPSGGVRGAVEIRVSDNGPGIPKKILDKIFQPFFTTKPTGSGTGLGLSLSYDIVKAHGGELKVKSEEGEGTEFTVVLPA